MKLARKLSLALLLGIFLVLGVFAYSRLQREISVFDSDLTRDHRMIGSTLRPAILLAWESGGEAQITELVRRADADREAVRLRWVRLDAPPGAPDSAAVTISESETTLHRGQTLQLTKPLPALGTGEYRISYIPVVTAGRLGAVEIAESLAQRSSYVRTMIVTTILATLAMAVVCGAVAVAIGRWVVGRPITRLIEKARRVGAGDLQGELTLKGNDELSELAHELNAMCDRLATARDKVEQETAARIQALERLRHADRLTTIGSLASAIAHEIGTPLNVIAGHARMISQGRLSGDVARESAATIGDQCDRIARIVRQVLDYGRRRDPKKTRVQITDVVRSTVDLLKPLIQKRGVHVEVDDNSNNLTASLDAAQVQQALTNLILNAVQASPEGAAVKIEISSVHDEAATKERTGDRVLVSVSDSGPGIGDEVLKRLFEPFFTTKEPGQGTGLGLSIAQEIVREHGGRIEVASRLGSGARFDVVLPCEVAI